MPAVFVSTLISSYVTEHLDRSDWSHQRRQRMHYFDDGYYSNNDHVCAPSLMLDNDLEVFFDDP